MTIAILMVNLVTLSRPLLVGYGCMLMLDQNWMAAWAFVLGGMLVTDVIDGPMARVLNAQTKFGEVADGVCDVLANWTLVLWCLVYAQMNFDWFKWQTVLAISSATIVIGIIFSINEPGIKFWKGVKLWFIEDKGDFVIGVSVAGTLLLWIAIQAGWLPVGITVICGLAALVFNWKKVAGFVGSALHLKGDA